VARVHAARPVRLLTDTHNRSRTHQVTMHFAQTLLGALARAGAARTLQQQASGI
jgi:hypothetical protein